MSRRRDAKPQEAAPQAAYAPALKKGAQALTTRVQEMHTAIADKTFGALQVVPGIAVPAKLVQLAHDAIAGGVYAAVRGGTGATMRLVGLAERVFRDSDREPEGAELALRSALNAAVGDALAEAHSPLAVSMTLLAQGVPLDEASSPEPWQALAPRVAVFVHGLACDEQSWHLFDDAWQGSPWAGDGQHYGALLERELAITPLYLRYNTGLAIGDNAAELARHLARLVKCAPQVGEIVLIGHSMGGLVARLACEISDGAAWRQRVPMVICLGSPHRGATLEKLGHFVATALGVSSVTRPLQRIANARSQGIQSLRHGLAAPGAELHLPPLRLVAGSLAPAEPDAGVRVLRKVLAKGLGDGLVTTRSALDARLLGDVERVELPGLGHMALLNHPRVYELLHRWLGDVPRG